MPLQEVVEDQAAADNKIPEIFGGGGHILLLVPLDIQLPRGDLVFDGQHLHIVGGPAQGPGNDSDAVIGGHHAVHNDVLGCLHGNLGLDAQAPEQLVGDGAQLAVVVERDEGLPVQLPQVMGMCALWYAFLNSSMAWLKVSAELL